MSKNRNRLLRFQHTSVEQVFAKETHLLKQVQAGEIDQCLMLWQTDKATLVLPAGNKWPESDSLKQALNSSGWQLYSRKTGGAPVPQCPGVINLSHIYQWPAEQDYSITQAYKNLCRVLTQFFADLGIETQAHATEFSYCDGDYNLNVNGKKIVGTAQRVVLKKGGGKIVLAQAFILVDVLLDELVKPVNLCYQLCEKAEGVKASVHTCLNEHLDNKLDLDSLYQKLSQAFIDNTL